MQLSKFRIEIKEKLGQWLDTNFTHGGINQYNKEEGRESRPSNMPVGKDESADARKIWRCKPDIKEKAIEIIEKKLAAADPPAAEKSSVSQYTKECAIKGVIYLE